MWEAKVAPGAVEDTVDWLREEVVPDALSRPGCREAEAFVDAAGERVVVISRWEDEALSDWQPGKPHRRLLVRSHTWPFLPV